MRTAVFLFAILVVLGTFIAQYPAEAACDFQQCWATCQKQYTIYFVRAFCDGGTCKCVYRTS
ncbi:Termicin [Cryptotermes secundus]|uniref:Termicin n=1 Tax=Cryptotermes secundus TaxID=105785 RepID=A0A2J7RQM5_9NEOP|nr:Termicin [Cryptotermes secundus]